MPSSPRKRGPSGVRYKRRWIPAFAGMTMLTKSPPPDKARCALPSHTRSASDQSSDTSHAPPAPQSLSPQPAHASSRPRKAGDGIEIRHAAPAPDDGIAVQLVLLVEPLTRCGDTWPLRRPGIDAPPPAIRPARSSRDRPRRKPRRSSPSTRPPEESGITRTHGRSARRRSRRTNH